MTGRIEPVFCNMTQRIEPFFFQFDSKIFEIDSKNRSLFSIRLNELNPFLKCDSFLEWFQELNLFLGKNNSKNWTWLNDLNSLFLKIDSKNRTFILMTPRLEASFKIMTQRIVFEKHWLKELNLLFLMWLKELNPFCMTQRIEPCVKKKDSKNRTLEKGLIEFNLFLWTSSQCDSKSWCLVSIMTRRIEPFLFSNMTQRIEIFSSVWLKELCFLYDSKGWTLFEFDLNLLYWIWPQELNLFSEYDSTN